MNRRHTTVVTGVALVGVTGVASWAVTNSRADDARPRPVTSVETGVVAVTRTDIAEREQVNGVLGHSGSYNVIALGRGTLTRLPAIGRVVERGQPAYEVNGVPVVLMYGARPPWRAFELGMTRGADVRQLEINLKALGYGNGLTVDRHFSTATYWAVRRWQKDAHLTVTGNVPLGQIVFVPAPIRIGAHDLKVGAPVQPGALVEHGTGAEQVIRVQLSPVQLPTVRVGDPVVVTLPDGATRTGKITAIGAVAVANPSDASDSGNGSGSENQSTAPVTVTVKGKIRGFLDQAQVQVAITVRKHRNVFAVPTTALRALPGGKYEVIVVEGTTTRHVPVETGLFDETTGLAEVSGTGLAEGQKVQVPREDA